MSLRINEVAQAAAVNRETLRYYERRGLLEQPERSPGGHRLYDARAVRALRISKAAQRSMPAATTCTSARPVTAARCRSSRSLPEARMREHDDQGRHLFGAAAAACAVCCAPPLLALLGIAGAGALATVATVAFAGLAFGLVVLDASLLGMWATRRERTPNEPCSVDGHHGPGVLGLGKGRRASTTTPTCTCRSMCTTADGRPGLGSSSGSPLLEQPRR